MKFHVHGSKTRFLCALFMGSILSGGWLVVNYVLTIIHERDAEIINFTGRLRYHTQQIGTSLLSKRYLPVMQTRDPFEQLHATVDGLLGKAAATEGSAPEMLDEEVKITLQEWVALHISPLRDIHSRVDVMAEAEVHAALHAVDVATSSVDQIVAKASEASKGRVRVLFACSLCRAITGFLWALTVTMCFGGVYRPYVATYNRLQVMEREAASFLNAAFDAVVAVSVVYPFNIIRSSEQFDHLMGQSMLGKSVLSCAQGPTEKEELQKLLDHAGNSGIQIRSWFSRLDSLCWWRSLPKESLAHTPVASMISTRWSHMLGVVRHSFQVEVLATNRSCVKIGDEDCPTLLVVRKATSEISSESQDAEIVPYAGLTPSVPAFPRESNDELIEPLSLVASSNVAPVAASSDDSASTSATVRVTPEQLAGAVTPRSGSDVTPPPSMSCPQPMPRMSRQLSSDVVLQIEHAVSSIPFAGSTSTGSATPPLVWGA